MGRETEDGRHEGAVVHVFADGMFGGSWGGGPIATTTADGTFLNASDWQKRADADVVAWRVQCADLTRSSAECWRGPTWTRVATAAEQDLARRRIYYPDSMLSGELEDLVMRDWETHIAPHQRVRPVELAAEEVARAQEVLTSAVRDARAEGASWADIGAAVGITRQSAHTRWAAITESATPRPNRGPRGSVEIGEDQPQPCGKLAVYRVEGYSPRDGRMHGSLDAVVYACEDHHDAARNGWLGELTPFSGSVDVDSDSLCGDSTDYRRMGLKSAQKS